MVASVCAAGPPSGWKHCSPVNSWPVGVALCNGCPGWEHRAFLHEHMDPQGETSENLTYGEIVSSASPVVCRLPLRA